MKISIITASYNYEEYIEEAIKSVIAQTYTDWELIIVDDGSSDNSVEIIKNYCAQDSRIKYFEHPNHENKGLKESILLGLQNCSGDWVAFLESDDSFLPDYLAEKVKIVNSYPDVNLIFNRVNFITENLSDKLKKKLKLFESIQNNLKSKKYPLFMEKSFFCHNQILTFSCAMVKKTDLQSVNFDAPIDSQLDWWLWVHLASKGKFFYINKSLSFWRLHDSSYTTKNKGRRLISTPILAYYDSHKAEERNFKFIWYLYLLLLIIFFKTNNFVSKQFRKIF